MAETVLRRVGMPVAVVDRSGDALRSAPACALLPGMAPVVAWGTFPAGASFSAGVRPWGVRERHSVLQWAAYAFKCRSASGSSPRRHPEGHLGLFMAPMTREAPLGPTPGPRGGIVTLHSLAAHPSQRP